MKQLFSILFVSLLFVACIKEETVDNKTQSEQSLKNVSYGTDTAQRMDIYLPAGRTTTTTKAIVMIHGGAWFSGDKTEMNQYIPVIKQHMPDYAIFNINYRLAAPPATHPFPTQENDVKAAMNYIVSKSGEYVFNADKVVILGASAGGHLALLQVYKNGTPKVKAVIDLFGPTDMTALYNSYTPNSINQMALQLLLGGTPSTNTSSYQSSSPVNFVSAQSAPTLILHGSADPIVPIAQSVALKTKLETAGVYVKMVTYQNAGHGDWSNATFEDAYQKIFSFLAEKNP